MKKYLIIGGILNVLLGIFHLFFWNIFDWPNTISCLSVENKGIMEVLNIQLTITILFFGYISIFHPKDLLSTKLGNIIILFITLFYVIRLFNEFIFWPINSVTFISSILLVVFILLYLIPFISIRKQNN